MIRFILRVLFTMSLSCVLSANAVTEGRMYECRGADAELSFLDNGPSLSLFYSDLEWFYLGSEHITISDENYYGGFMLRVALNGEYDEATIYLAHPVPDQVAKEVNNPSINSTYKFVTKLSMFGLTSAEIPMNCISYLVH